MPNDSKKIVEVDFTSEFKRNIRHLSKKYRHIKSDIQSIIEELESGKTPGDQVQRIKYIVFKIRVKNSDIKKGKRSGYRVIYFVRSKSKIILITIYSKTEQGDISSDQIRRIILEYEAAIKEKG